MTTPRCGLLFHFTHMDNLPAIAAAGMLLSDTAVCAAEVLAAEAGDPEIKSSRRSRGVPCGPGGVVADYVPFYFAARSPMMYKLWCGGVPTFTGDHRDLVYLVSHVDRMVSAGVPFVLSDRNATKAVAAFSTDVSVLGDLNGVRPESSFVDWPLMTERIWKNTRDDGERMERRMAEFLVHGNVPLDLLVGVAVASEERVTRVEQTFASVGGDQMRVAVRSEWYYP